MLLSFGLLDEDGVGNDISDKVVSCAVFSCIVLSLSLSSSRLSLRFCLPCYKILCLCLVDLSLSCFLTFAFI